MKDNETSMDHEIRIRLLEQLSERTFQKLEQLDSKLSDKIDNQFKWTIGTILALFGGVILHSAKLI